MATYLISHLRIPGGPQGWTAQAPPLVRCCGTSSVSCRSLESRSSAAGPAVRAANWRWRATCGSPRGRTPYWGSPRSVSVRPRARVVQHLGRLLGRGRAMEVNLGAADFDADEAERYGWVNRALPDAELDAFVARLARRIASFLADAVRSTKQVLNDLTLPGADAIRADARRFQQLVGSDTVKARAASLFAEGLQSRGPLELGSDAAHRVPHARHRRPAGRTLRVSWLHPDGR